MTLPDTPSSNSGVSVPNRLEGLDSIRFVCALIVLHNHIGNPQPLAAFAGSRLADIINSIGGILFYAPAAVIIFFVLSGLCIHYPYARGRTLNTREFLMRRYVRLGIPLLVLTPLAIALGVDFKLFDNNVLWSLFAELVYYTLYPFLLSLSRRIGWSVLLGVSFLISLALFLAVPNASIYPAFGISLNWLAGLPCWLLGVRLAERVPSLHAQKPRFVGLWRLTAWAGMSATLILHFHTEFTTPFSLNLFAIVAYLWLASEIRHYHSTKPWAVLERLGRWSYSLYLAHLPVVAVIYLLIPHGLSWNIRWLLMATSCLLGGRLFYQWVERPSHQLARTLKIMRHRPAPSH